MSEPQSPAPQQPSMPPQPAMPPQQPAPPPSAPAQPSAMSTMVSSMSQWELFLVGGALVLVIGDLLFGILLREKYAGDLIWVAAAVALVAFFANRRTPGSVPMYANLMLVAGAVVALLGVREFIVSLLFALRNLDSVGSVYLIALVVWTVGLALMAWGAWLAWRSRGA